MEKMPTEQILSNDEIYHILEDEIVSLKLRPGEAVTEKAFCERFHVSRTPIRSVLQRLQENKFIEIVPYKSTHVTTIDLDIAVQFIYQRVAVETMVLRDFINSCSPQDVERIRYCFHTLQEIADNITDVNNFDINEFLQKDLEMHSVWFQATGKEFLWKQLTKPQADYSRFLRLDILKANNIHDVISEHIEIMRLIDERNTDDIEALISKHLYGGVRRLGGKLFSGEYKDFFKNKD